MATKRRTKTRTKAGNAKTDVLVAGGGYVGLCVAVSIKASAPHLDVQVVDPAPEEALQNDERALGHRPGCKKHVGPARYLARAWSCVPADQ